MITEASTNYRQLLLHCMTPTQDNPRALLLSGGVEFQRAGTGSRIASLDTLLEQEERYTQILVDKVVALRPDLMLVGKGVSRAAQVSNMQFTQWSCVLRIYSACICYVKDKYCRTACGGSNSAVKHLRDPQVYDQAACCDTLAYTSMCFKTQISHL
jgi:hypothetical protein